MFDIGSSLRDARVRSGLDFPDLEQRTKIRPKYLRALEDERFDILPAPTYVRGFLRAYADALGLDGQPFVDEYNTRFAVGDEDTVVRARRVPVSPRRERGRQERESRMAALALVSIAVVTALVIAAWRFGGPENEAVHGLAQSEQQAPHTRSLAPTRLVVHAARNSWMEVRAGSASGRLLYSGTLERGQRKSFDGRRLHLALARPDNVSLRVNGKAVAVPAGTTFSITARRIAPAIP